MSWYAHLMARFSKEVVIFGATFFGSRLVASGTVRQLVFSNDFQEGIEEGCLFARFAVSGMNGISKVAQAVEGAFKTEPAQFHAVGDGGMLHEGADEVVGDE